MATVKNTILKVLIACEESQAVCKAFRALGHDAFSCDIQPCSGGHPEWHIVGDCTTILNGNCTFVTQSNEKNEIKGCWDILIAHPPCTYLTKANAVRMFVAKGKVNQERYKKMLLARDFFLSLLNADCQYIAIENPVPLHIAKLPPRTTYIQPSWFGHPFTKQTCLWLKQLPPLIPTCYCAKSSSWTATKRSAKQRSKTFYGIAEAMAIQWSAFVIENKKA